VPYRAAARNLLLRVAFVCTGNRARSPLAAALFSRHAGTKTVEVGSYGLLDTEGLPPLEPAAAVGARLGIDIKRHRARRLSRGALGDADIVVGFEHAHAAAAVEVGGASPEQVFLLLELPPLLEALRRSQPSDLEVTRSVIGELHRLRTAAGPRSVAPLPDPLGEPEQVFAEAARVIDAVTGALADAVLRWRDAVSASRPAR
jgi:protein-tyrosine-phosphatase